MSKKLFVEAKSVAFTISSRPNHLVQTRVGNSRTDQIKVNCSLPPASRVLRLHIIAPPSPRPSRAGKEQKEQETEDDQEKQREANDTRNRPDAAAITLGGG